MQLAGQSQYKITLLETFFLARPKDGWLPYDIGAINQKTNTTIILPSALLRVWYCMHTYVRYLCLSLMSPRLYVFYSLPFVRVHTHTHTRVSHATLLFNLSTAPSTCLTYLLTSRFSRALLYHKRTTTTTTAAAVCGAPNQNTYNAHNTQTAHTVPPDRPTYLKNKSIFSSMDALNFQDNERTHARSREWMQYDTRSSTALLG